MTTTPVPPSGPGGKGRPTRRLSNPRDSWPAKYGEPLDFDPAAWGPEPDDLDAPAEPDADGPDADAARWAAENLNDDWHDPDGPDDDGPGPDYDALADDAAILDRLEAGYLPC